jgi:hypothetical protein
MASPIKKLLGDGDPTKLDKAFLAKVNHARDRLQVLSAKRDEAWEFYRGNHFVYVEKDKLQVLAAGSPNMRVKGKPPHRARQARNLIFDVVLREAANASQQVPSYQIQPSTGDPADVSAASLAEKVALYGYEKWELRRATVDAVIGAVVAGESFAWPYFDTSVGPFIGDEEGDIGVGEVSVRIYGANECYWVPGLRFDDSPWHCVEQARTVEEIEAMPGYLLGPGKLSKDADTRALAKRKTDQAKLVMVTDYLERPCAKYPEGRWVTIANGKQILPERPYPGTGDSPCLRKLSYAPDPDSDRDMGLVSQLLDANRTINDAENKAIEWKNLTLMPQFAVTPGLMKKQRRTDEPGKAYEIPNPNENLKVIEPPNIPSELFTMADRGKDDLLRIAGQMDVPAGVESGKAIQALIEKNQARAQLFIASLADWHARVMHDCLHLVQTHYEEPRLIQLKGEFGWESIADFKGAQLRDQIDVRVYTDSIEPQTRQDKNMRIHAYVQMGALDPTEAMVAMETGATDRLIRSFAQDEARIGRIIQRIKDGTVMQMPKLPTGRLKQVPTGAVDPMTGQPQMVDSGETEMAPGWMPRYSDNLGIFRRTLEDWMKTEEYERVSVEPVAPSLDPETGMPAIDPDSGMPMQQTLGDVAALIYAGVLLLESEKAAADAQAQAEQAAGLGMQNAAAPQDKPLPSLPSPNGTGEQQPTPSTSTS